MIFIGLEFERRKKIEISIQFFFSLYYPVLKTNLKNMFQETKMLFDYLNC